MHTSMAALSKANSRKLEKRGMRAAFLYLLLLPAAFSPPLAQHGALLLQLSLLLH